MMPMMPMDGTGAPLGGVPLQVIGLVLLVAVLAIYAAITWRTYHADRVRERVDCPVYRQKAFVWFRVAVDGARTDVVRCSLFRGRPAITCGKVCLRNEAAA